MSKKELNDIILSRQLYDENTFTVNKQSDGEYLGEITITATGVDATNVNKQKVSLLNKDSAIIFLLRSKKTIKKAPRITGGQTTMFDLLR